MHGALPRPWSDHAPVCGRSHHLVTGHAGWHVLAAPRLFFHARHQAERPAPA